MNDGFLLKKSFGQTLLERAYDSIFPNKCLFCKRVLEDLGEVVCGDCVELCGGDYDIEAVRQVVFRFKYEGKRMLARSMGRVIFRRIGDVEADCLVCVPLHESRLRERGFNQSELLAEELSRLYGLPAYDGMVRIRETARQFDLNPEERVANVTGAFVVREGFCVEGKDVLLVDDILTTGATAAECARVLTEAGARSVELVVFAAVEAWGGIEPPLQMAT